MSSEENFSVFFIFIIFLSTFFFFNDKAISFSIRLGRNVMGHCGFQDLLT